MKYLIISSLLYFLFLNSAISDTILLRNGSKMNGELIRISSSEVMIEVYKEKGTKIFNISLIRDNIYKIIDESGIALFEMNKQIHPDLKEYYHPVSGLISSLPRDPESDEMDSLRLTSGEDLVGCIKKVSEYSLLFTIASENEKSELKGKHISFNRIEIINGVNIRELLNQNYDIEKPSKIAYPQVGFELAGSFSVTKLDYLASLFQYYYESAEQTNLAGDRNSTYFMIQFSLLLKFSHAIAIGFTGHQSFTPGDDHYRLFLSEIRYYLNFKDFKPWIALGYGWQSVRIEDTPAIFIGKSKSVSFGFGLELGAEKGLGFFTAFRYLPMEEQMVTGYGVNIGKVDFSALLFSAGLRVYY